MKKYFTRWGFYLLGMFILALGICLNDKSNLGVSPLISVAKSFSEIIKISFSTAILILYLTYVAIEIVIHWTRKKYKTIFADVLQIPISFIFTKFVGLFDWMLPSFTVANVGKLFGSTGFRVFILILAVILTGIGAALSLNAKLVPNPGDGIVQAVSDVWGKSVGLTKNCLDCGSVLLSFLICVIFVRKQLFAGSIIGIGTLIAMIGVGRVIAIFNHFTKVKIARMSGVDLNLDPKANAKQTKKDYKAADKAAGEASKAAKQEAKEAKEAKKDAKEAEKAVKLAKQAYIEAKEAAKGKDDEVLLDNLEKAAQALREAEENLKEAEKTVKKEVKEAKDAKSEAKEASKMAKEAKKEAQDAKKAAANAEKEAKASEKASEDK